MKRNMNRKFAILIFCECLKVLICILSRILLAGFYSAEQHLPFGVLIFTSCMVILFVAYCFVVLRMILTKNIQERRELLILLTNLSSTAALLSIINCVLMIYQKVAVIGA